MEKQIVRTVKTKLNKDDKNTKVTVVTWNTQGVTVDHLIDAALQTLTINLQGQFRRKKEIPQKIEVNVVDAVNQMGSRASVPQTVDGLAAVASTFSAEQRDALIKKLQDEAKQAAKQAKAPKGGKSPQAEQVQ